MPHAATAPSYINKFSHNVISSLCLPGVSRTSPPTDGQIAALLAFASRIIQRLSRHIRKLRRSRFHSPSANIRVFSPFRILLSRRILHCAKVRLGRYATLAQDDTRGEAAGAPRPTSIPYSGFCAPHSHISFVYFPQTD